MFKILLNILLFICTVISSQNVHVFKFIKYIDKESIRVEKRSTDLSGLEVSINKILMEYQNSGYLLATCDSLAYNTDTASVFISKNLKFANTEIRLDTNFCSNHKNLCSEINVLTSNTLTSNSLKKVNRLIQSYFENNGYPFVKFEYSSMNVDSNLIRVDLKVDPFVRIINDTIVFDQPLKSKNSYLQSLLGIQKGAVYSQLKVDQIRNIVSRSPLYELKSEPYVEFRLDKAYIHLDLIEKRSTRFNGLIGYLPDAITKKNVLIGEGNINLSNLFGYGIAYDLQWKRFQSQSQNLNTSLTIPFVLKSPIGINMGINILKQDSTFVNISRNFGFSYDISPSLKAGASYLYTSSTINSGLVKENISTMSSILKQYGITLQSNTTNDRFFPNKGYKVLLENHIGNKDLLSSAVDSLPKSSLQYNGSLIIESYFRLSNRAALFSKNSSKLLYNNKNVISVNDLYRLGGINDLRGFNEKNFFVDRYNLTSLEYRFLLSTDTYINIYIDYGYLKVPFATASSQNAIGGGVGLVFRSQLGMMQLYYSLGKSGEQDITIQNSKIHFSLSNNF